MDEEDDKLIVMPDVLCPFENITSSASPLVLARASGEEEVNIKGITNRELLGFFEGGVGDEPRAHEFVEEAIVRLLSWMIYEGIE